MQNVQKKYLKDELQYNGEVILKYVIEYPQICDEKWKSTQRFNKYNYERALMIQKRCEGELFNEAKELYEYNKANGYPIMVYEIYVVFEVTYNTNNILSLYTDDYIYSGGAHGNTIRSSQNWDFRIGRPIPLQAFFMGDPNYVSKILTQINNKIQEDINAGNNIYFENYCELVVQNFNVNNYYLSDGNIVIYFQQYDIGPYSSGIITFNILYK